MSITRKPQPPAPGGEPPKIDIDYLISKGGSVPNPEPTSGGKPKVTSMILRIPGEIGQRLNQALQARPVRLPRHTWILEAIVEKLDRESN